MIKISKKILLFAFLTIYCGINIIPVLWSIRLSFLSSKDILAGSFFASLTLEGYRYVFDTVPVWRYIMNSIFVASISTLLNVLSVAFAAYTFSKHNIPFGKIIYAAIISSFFIPNSVLMGPVYITMSKLGLVNNYVALIIVYAGLSLSSSMLIMKHGFDSVPREICDAAALDGAGSFRIIFSIMIPNIKGAVATAATLCFITGWNDFTYALLLTDSNASRTVSLAVSYFISQFSYNHSALFAAVAMAMLPGIIILMLSYRYIFLSFDER